MAADPTTAGQKSFFERERDKLIGEIAEGLETLLSTSNTLNRKLEESISVGKEFEPIAGLWGRFSELMTAAGVPDPTRDNDGGGPSDATNAASGQLGEERDVLMQSLPRGVAPGGGTVYGRET